MLCSCPFEIQLVPVEVHGLLRFCILSMITLPQICCHAAPRQFCHSVRSPPVGIFTIKPVYYWSGNFSLCHILFSGLVNSFIGTSPSTLYSSAGIPPISVVFPVFCLLQRLPDFFLYLCCSHFTNFV